MAKDMKAKGVVVYDITRATRCCLNCESYEIGWQACGNGQRAVCVDDGFGDCAVGYNYKSWPKKDPMDCCDHYHRKPRPPKMVCHRRIKWPW